MPMCSRCKKDIPLPRKTGWELIDKDTIRRYLYDDCPSCKFSHTTIVIYEGAGLLEYVKARKESINLPSNVVDRRSDYRMVPGGSLPSQLAPQRDRSDNKLRPVHHK